MSDNNKVKRDTPNLFDFFNDTNDFQLPNVIHTIIAPPKQRKSIWRLSKDGKRIYSPYINCVYQYDGISNTWLHVEGDLYHVL